MTMNEEMTVKTKTDLKMELSSLVARKMELTRARVALKRIPYKDRTHEQHAQMMRLWNDCRIVKESIRFVTLAYAFVRGRRYWHVERRVHEAPWARGIAGVAEADEVAVKLWLAEQPTAEELASWSAHVAAAETTARAARIERAAQRTLGTMGLAC